MSLTVAACESSTVAPADVTRDSFIPVTSHTNGKINTEADTSLFIATVVYTVHVVKED